ncbi:MAG: hypothetical protein ABIO76_03490 [Ginsengibacter sp.]
MKKLLLITIIATTSFSCKKEMLNPAIISETAIMNTSASAVSSSVQKILGSENISSWFWDNCTNERVNIAGTIRWNYTLVYKGEYGYSPWYINTVHLALTNIKATGAISELLYQVINVNNYTAFNDSLGNLYRYTNYSILKLIAPKDASTMTLTVHATLVIDATGTTVIDYGIGDYILNCKK